MKTFEVSCIALAACFVLGLAGCGGSSSSGPDAACSGMVCGGACVDPMTDVNNCGACGNACTAGQVCQAGTCESTCTGASNAVCNGTCVDTSTDNANCGACGNACASGTSCDGTGQCATTCSTGYSACGTGDSSYCAALDTDRENCGACGMQCAAGQVCRGGCTGITLTSLSASTALAGASITLTGTGFDPLMAGDTVFFGTFAATITSASDTQIVVTVPAGITGANPVHVESQGVASNSLPFAPWETTAPVAVNGTLTGCSMQGSMQGRKVAVAGSGAIYATFFCAGNLYVATSVDGGHSFAAPVQVPGLASVNQAAVQARADQTVYVAVFDAAGLQFSVSSDGGQTWAATPTTLQGNSGNFLSLASANTTVWAFAGTNVYTNTTAGQGAFTSSNPAVSVVFGDVLEDSTTNTLLAVGDTPNFHIATSTDGGATFGPVVDVDTTAGEFDSDWALGGGTIFSLGASSEPANTLWLMSEANPAGTPTAVSGAIVQGGLNNAITADSDGNAYVTGVDPSNGQVYLQQYTPGATALTAPQDLAAGTSPAVATGLAHSAVSAYVDGTGTVQVQVTVFP